jgi:LPXTG-motif cell wall-anchored protein
MTALAVWDARIGDLAAAVSRLQEAVTNQQVALVGVRRTAVEQELARASEAVKAFAATGASAPTDVQSRWVATLGQASAVLTSAKNLMAMVPSGNGGSSGVDTLGLRIPGTGIVVPWAAVLGILAVIGAGMYFSKRR